MSPQSKHPLSRAAGAALCLGLLTPFIGAVLEDTPAISDRPDRQGPRHIVGPDECASCHEQEAAVWEESAHHRGGQLLARNEQARNIAAALGIRRLKTAEGCTQCHFTVKETHERDVETIAGVSCESCHGTGEAWIDVHPPAVAETAEERASRLERCDQLGMRRPIHLYELASTCYRCHIVANETVVNQGGHPMVSGFELVSGTQGAMRHNFLGDGGRVNAVAPLERRRMMFVIGHALKLEHAVRALASSHQPGVYRDGMLRYVREARSSLMEIQALQPVAEVASLIESSEGYYAACEEFPASAELEELADRIGDLTRAFEQGHDGTGLATLDPLLPVIRDD